MATKTRRTTVAAIRARLRKKYRVGAPALLPSPVGHLVVGRDHRLRGVVTAAPGGYCGLEGCPGTRLHVTWCSGHRRRLCTKGLLFDEATRTWTLI
jgi:hypothetical protein